MFIAAAALAASAVPAAAQDWRWLEKLSGPGHFYGYELDVKLVCKYDQEERIVGISFPCPQQPKEENARKREYAAGVGLSYLAALSNKLLYASAPDVVDRTVRIIALEGFYDHRFPQTQNVEYGIVGGVNWFQGDAFDTFTRVSLEPRVSFRLLDLNRGNSYKGRFMLRAGVLFFLKGFKAEDFGAIPGSWKSGTEITPSLRFVFDFDRNPFK